MKVFFYTEKRGGSVNETSPVNYIDLNDFRLFNELMCLICHYL